jgi:branched-chain amino acid transport system ATP-binding protein
MLDLENVNAYYGDSHILHGVSLAVKEGEVVCLLGRNGAGKTTTILTIMGYLKPRPGRILYRGRDIAALPPYAVARLGFGFVPQERGIFPSLTVRENLTVFARARADGRWTLERVLELFPSLRARAQPRLPAFRRGAADALHRARPHAQSFAAAARRAVGRTGADDRARHRRGAQESQA